MKKVLILVVVLVMFLTGCASSYDVEWQYAFNGPDDIAILEYEEDNVDKEICQDEKVLDLVDFLEKDIRVFVKDTYDVDLPEKSIDNLYWYYPGDTRGGSYYNNEVFINKDNYTEINDEFTLLLVHELIHFYTDNKGSIGYIHELSNDQIESTDQGDGLTEGLTVFITTQYAKYRGYEIPEYYYLNQYEYSHVLDIVRVLYIIDPKVCSKFFNSDYKYFERLLERKTFSIPFPYDVSISFWAYTDCLVRNKIEGNNEAFARNTKKALEIVSYMSRDLDKEDKKAVYEIIKKYDNLNFVWKEIMFNSK